MTIRNIEINNKKLIIHKAKDSCKLSILLQKHSQTTLILTIAIIINNISESKN